MQGPKLLPNQAEINKVFLLSTFCVLRGDRTTKPGPKPMLND